MGMVYKEDGSLGPEPGFLTGKIKAMEEFQSDVMPQVDIDEYEGAVLSVLCCAVLCCVVVCGAGWYGRFMVGRAMNLKRFLNFPSDPPL